MTFAVLVVLIVLIQYTAVVVVLRSLSIAKKKKRTKDSVEIIISFSVKNTRSAPNAFPHVESHLITPRGTALIPVSVSTEELLGVKHIGICS